jgi:hypothetical protein
MKRYAATIDILIHAESEAEAMDAIAEALRPLLKAFAVDPNKTAWVDWQYNNEHRPAIEESDGTGFEEYGNWPLCERSED